MNFFKINGGHLVHFVLVKWKSVGVILFWTNGGHEMHLVQDEWKSLGAFCLGLMEVSEFILFSINGGHLVHFV